MTRPLEYDVCVDVIRQGYDRQTCWVQTRAGVLPPDGAVISTQKLRLSGSDIFYAIHSMRSGDQGRTWSEPASQSGLGRQTYAHDGSCEMCPCDGTPTWHAATGKLLLTGHTAVYRDDELARGYRRNTWYSVYDQDRDCWSDMRLLEVPEEGILYSCGAGCAQRYDFPDGTILLPVYGRPAETNQDPWHTCSAVTVLKCSFDGSSLAYVERGNELCVPEPRGLGEPSLTRHGGRFYMTLRNDVRGYVATSDDGLHFSEPTPWCFDDGAELGSYNTQQHWLCHSDELFLVYTRRGLENDHVFRHRAPLVMARVDTERLCVVRDTERIVVPEHGARLGNFGTVMVSRDESWVVVSEWMQTTPPDPHDCTVCERYGADNRIYLSRIRWNRPNDAVLW